MTRILAIRDLGGPCAELPRGRVNTKRAPPPGHVLDPDALAVGLDERLGDRQPEPGPASGVEAHEAVEHAVALVGGEPRALVGHRQRDSVAAYLGGHGDRGPGRGVAVGVVEQVDEHLADEHRVDVHVGQSVGELQVDRPVSEGGAQAGRPRRPPGRATAAGPSLARSSTPASIAVHVEQAGHQAGEAVGLRRRSVRGARGHRRRRGCSRVEQGRRRHLHRGEWGPQVVGDRAEQVPGAPGRPPRAARSEAPGSRAGPVRGPARHGWRTVAQQVPVGVRCRQAPEGEHARPGRSGDRERHRAELAGDPPERCRRGPARPDSGSSWRRSSAVIAIPAEAATASWSPSGTRSATPSTSKRGPDRADDGLEQLLDRAVLDQHLGQRRRGVGPPASRRWASASACLEVGGDAGHQQHHHHVDAEGDPVLARADREAVVGAG